MTTFPRCVKMLPFSIHSCLPYPRTLSNRSDRPLRYRWRNPPRFCSLCFGVRFPPKLNVALRRLALFFALRRARFLLFALRWRVLANARLLFYAGGVPLPLFFVRFLFRVCVWRVLAGGRVWLAFSVFRVRFALPVRRILPPRARFGFALFRGNVRPKQEEDAQSNSPSYNTS